MIEQQFLGAPIKHLIDVQLKQITLKEFDFNANLWEIFGTIVIVIVLAFVCLVKWFNGKEQNDAQQQNIAISQDDEQQKRLLNKENDDPLNVLEPKGQGSQKNEVEQIKNNQFVNNNDHTAVPILEQKNSTKIQKQQQRKIDSRIEQEQQKSQVTYKIVQSESTNIGEIKHFQKQDNVKDQENQLNQTLKQQENNRANQIINEKFYQPSFKQRKVEDEYLKNFIRGFKKVKQFQEEYNLDDSQQEILNNQISKFVPIRGDGNCMFTSIGFQYLYYNLIDEGRFKRLLELIKQTRFKQKYENKQVEAEDEVILRKAFRKQLKSFSKILDQQQLLQEIAKSINDHDGPLYGLVVIFLRNYFRKILQDFYDNDEMNFLIQDPEQINQLIAWEFMYDEADIALKLFAQKEKILIKCFKKMNVEDKIVDISDYHDDDQKEFSYTIGLAFQPGHYNAILVKN